MTTGEEQGLETWKKFLRRHWRMTLVMIGAAAAAAIVALVVFLWFVADAQATGLVPVALGQWTVGSFFAFVLNLILWELVLVGSWAILAAIAVYALWYRKLAAEERKEYEGGPRRRRLAGGGGGFSFFVWVMWLIVVWTDGKWDLAFQTWTFDEWVYSWLAAGLWALLIVGIPGMIIPHMVSVVSQKIAVRESKRLHEVRASGGSSAQSWPTHPLLRLRPG